MKKESRYLVIIGLFYAAFLLLFISKFNFNASATVEFSQNYLNRTPVTIPGGLVIHQSDGFDGQYYYALAAHHSLKGIPTLKMGENFTQRLIYPLLTYLLSFGNVALFPIMFILINIAAVLLSSHLLMKLLKKHGADLRYVFIWGLSVGLLVSLSRNLTEPLMMLFIACAVYYADQKKQLVAMIFLALSLLTRELAITVWAGFALFYMLRRQWKHLLYAIAAIIPFIGWEYVLYHFTGGIPLLKSSQALSSPVATVSSYGGSASSAYRSCR
jgi:Gpi18-like mannosyltransferase